MSLFAECERMLKVSQVSAGAIQNSPKWDELSPVPSPDFTGAHVDRPQSVPSVTCVRVDPILKDHHSYSNCATETPSTSSRAQVTTSTLDLESACRDVIAALSDNPAFQELVKSQPVDLPFDGAQHLALITITSARPETRLVDACRAIVAESAAVGMPATGLSGRPVASVGGQESVGGRGS